jgi:hypothetical protein
MTQKQIVLPYPSLGFLFKGRAAFPRRLRDSLVRPKGAAAIAGRAVHSMGGVRKTRAAVEYAWTHRADYTALSVHLLLGRLTGGHVVLTSRLRRFPRRSSGWTWMCSACRTQRTFCCQPLTAAAARREA